MSFWAFFDPCWPLGVGGESKLVGLDGPFEAIFGDFRALLGTLGLKPSAWARVLPTALDAQP